nr:MAG: ORF1 [TTV-like mini virus]
MAYYYKNYWNNYRRRPYRYRQRRLRFYRRRPKRALRKRYRRRNWVRKRNFYFKPKRKLKKIKLTQFQPNKIRKTKIKGYLQLFGGGHGRFTNNFTMYKESIPNPHEPGGGGWGLQQMTLSNLYVQNQYIMNTWTVSNKGLNLVKYSGCKFKLFRQPTVDYIFYYDIEPPYDVTKYYYCSLHPFKMLQYKHRVIVPSLQTAPLKKRTYITKRIRPPKEYINKWYFQQHLANFPLIQFVATSCSLTNMFQPNQTISNTVSLFTINTRFFQRANMQTLIQASFGYMPKANTYLYGIKQPSVPWTATPIKRVIYLGNTMINDAGDEIGEKSATDYGLAHWGNPFFHMYLHGEFLTFITEHSPQHLITTYKDKKISDVTPLPTLKMEPLVEECRYNPNYDKGTGNEAYWVQNNILTQQTWEPPRDPAFHISDYPLWLMLYGWEDFTRKQHLITNLDDNGILVIKSRYLNTNMPYFVLIAEGFYSGRGLYDQDPEEIPHTDMSHWFIKWRFQKPSIETLLTTGPGICKAESQKSVQAYCKYEFFFKWGGNPSTMETIADPTAQPIWPTPGNQLINNEIINPATSIENYLYTWDIRRDTLTQAATKRIKEISTDDISLFTDGDQDSETSQTTPPKKKAKKEEKTPLLQQLNLIQQHNHKLQLRLRQLKTIAQNM